MMHCSFHTKSFKINIFNTGSILCAGRGVTKNSTLCMLLVMFTFLDDHILILLRCTFIILFFIRILYKINFVFFSCMHLMSILIFFSAIISYVSKCNIVLNIPNTKHPIVTVTSLFVQLWPDSCCMILLYIPVFKSYN